MSCRLAIIVGAFLLCCTNSSVWEQHRIGSYTYIFRQSKREVSRQQQFDPMLIWIGSASNALQVSYTHGPVPLPTIWSSFVNVLYVTKCDSQATPFTEQFLAFYASCYYHMRAIAVVIYFSWQICVMRMEVYIFLT